MCERSDISRGTPANQAAAHADATSEPIRHIRCKTLQTEWLCRFPIPAPALPPGLFKTTRAVRVPLAASTNLVSSPGTSSPSMAMTVKGPSSVLIDCVSTVAASATVLQIVKMKTAIIVRNATVLTAAHRCLATRTGATCASSASVTPTLIDKENRSSTRTMVCHVSPSQQCGYAHTRTLRG